MTNAEEESRPCQKCNGEGKRKSFFPGEPKRECVFCSGTGKFAPLDREIILSVITSSRGRNKGKLKVSMISASQHDGVTANRAYYVWRLARFHGGIDMSQPIMADIGVSGDPFQKELDALADEVAKKYLGSNMRAAITWGRALGMI